VRRDLHRLARPRPRNGGSPHAVTLALRKRKFRCPPWWKRKTRPEAFAGPSEAKASSFKRTVRGSSFFEVSI